jgi:outer membrane protein, multidrug efflux system
MINIKHTIAVLVGGTLLLASCKIVLPYKSPNELTKGLYRDTTSQDTTNMAVIPWNKIFADTSLIMLIQEGLGNNFDLQIAELRIREAEANFRQSRVAWLPSFSANADATINTTLSNTVSQPYDMMATSSWELDIWGKFRSAKRANRMALLQSEAYKRAVQTQLISDIALDYYTLLGYDAQLQITEQTVDNRKQDVEIMKQLKESNIVTGAAVVQSEANRYSAEVTIPDLKQNIREMENSICILLGRSPGGIARTSLSSQKITVDLKTGVPVQLLAYRPDVQEAEYALRYYCELTKVARSYFYPTLSISAEAGSTNNKISQLFNASSLFRNIVGGLTQPIFNRGINKQRLILAKAKQEESLFSFKKTLLMAGQEVSNSLFKYQSASEKMDLRSKQISYTEKSVEYTKELLKYSSATNYTDVLTSEQSLLSAQLSSISDKLEQLQAVITLYRSLGGGCN